MVIQLVTFNAWNSGPPSLGPRLFCLWPISTAFKIRGFVLFRLKKKKEGLLEIEVKKPHLPILTNLVITSNGSSLRDLLPGKAERSG